MPLIFKHCHTRIVRQVSLFALSLLCANGVYATGTAHMLQGLFVKTFRSNTGVFRHRIWAGRLILGSLLVLPAMAGAVTTTISAPPSSASTTFTVSWSIAGLPTNLGGYTLLKQRFNGGEWKEVIGKGLSGGSHTVTVSQSGTYDYQVIYYYYTPCGPCAPITNGGVTAVDTTVVTLGGSPPTISNIGNRTINENGNTGNIAFTVGDAQTPAGSLTVTATSSNTTLIPNNGSNLTLGGSGGSRTIKVTPAANQYGTATVTVKVSDGVQSANDTFVVTVNDTPPVPNGISVSASAVTMLPNGQGRFTISWTGAGYNATVQQTTNQGATWSTVDTGYNSGSTTITRGPGIWRYRIRHCNFEYSYNPTGNPSLDFVCHNTATYPFQIDGLADPGHSGEPLVTSAEYSYSPITVSNLGSVDFKAIVHFPSVLSQGPYPLVMFMHGHHETCNGTPSKQWPCSNGVSEIPSYRGYDYLASVLASHGFIVVSISTNAINAKESATAQVGSDPIPPGSPLPPPNYSIGLTARDYLLQRHLAKWQELNTTGDSHFGNLFVGRVDMDNIGTMGHSRGGEGVARHFANNPVHQPRAVFLLAPTNYYRELVDNVPLGVLLPYCDGDNFGLQGVKYYDDALYSSSNDAFGKHSFLVMGANHNYYNSVWTSDDWDEDSSDPHCAASSAQRLSSSEQRGTALAYITAFFRAYLGGETGYMDILTGDAPPPPSAMTTDIHVSYQPPTSQRLDINRLDDSSNKTLNDLGGSVLQNGLVSYDICGTSTNPCIPQAQDPDFYHQPHTLPSYSGGKPGLSQLLLRWDNSGDWYENQLPAGYRDIGGYEALQFRAGVNYLDSPVNQTQDFNVELRDTAGSVASVRVGSVSDALFYPPGSISSEYLPKLILNTVRIPLSEFSGVDFSNIVAIRFAFGQTSQGAISVSDLALTN